MNTWKKSLPIRNLRCGFTLVLILGILCITAPSVARDVPFPTKHTVDDNFDGAFGAHAADVDGDGDLDILAAANVDNDITWWENVDLFGPGTGDGSAWTEGTVDGAFSGAFDVYAADVDGDSDMDILGAAYSDDDIAWFENTAGDGSAWTERTVDPIFDGAISVHAADMDGDGDMDVLGAAFSDDDITWWANTNGAGTSWSARTVDASFDGAYDVYAADMDGDGDMDVLGAATIADDISWWENTNGIGTTWAEHSVEAEFDGAGSVYAADVDGDGDLDVLGAANTAGDINWWENTGPCNGPGGACTTWGEHTVDGDFSGASSVYAADVDEDGDMDVLGTASSADDVTWWENTDGDGDIWTERTVDGDFDGANSVYAADVDGDGDLDVLSAANVADDVAWWENETIHRSTTFPAAGEDIVGVDFENATSVYAADIDGDGDTDILGAADNANGPDAIQWWENTAGDGSAWITRVVTNTWDGARRIYAVDVDGDGDLDILGAAYNDNELAWFENDGTPTVGIWRFHWLGNSSGARDTYAADVDGDGDMDMLEASELAQDIAWWENTAGDGLTWTKHVVEPVFGYACAVHAADLDEDGDLDILGASYTEDAIQWWENAAGDGSSWTEYTVTVSFNGPWDVSTADMDGDGDLDVLGAGYVADDITWWENDGTPKVGVWTEHPVDDNFDGPREVYAIDVDGDSDIDVLSAAYIGDSITWWENVDMPAGPGTGVGLYWAEHTVAEFNGARGVHAADVDGDGDVDVLGASWVENTIVWWENRGGQFALATIDTAPATMNLGDIDDILDIEVIHRGGNGDSDLELATLELLFQGCYGAGCTPANLTSAQANELFDVLRVYKDTGSGVFESGTDTLVANVLSLVLTDGVQTITFSDGDPNVQVAYGTLPPTYFVVVDRVNTPPETPTVDRFTITHITESSSTAEDRSHDIGLILEYVTNTISSQVVLNQAPIADAGGDQSMSRNALVTLDGSGSSDPDGNLPLTYGWTQTGGTAVALSNPAAVAPTFTAPGDPTVLTFNLVVTDSLGSPDPTPDQVVITVSNQAPIADAGSDQSVDTNAPVALNGSGSSDPDGDLPLTYGWTQTGGTAVTLSNPAAVAPTFTAPGAPTVLTFNLVVTDSLGLPDSTPDQVVITVLQDQVLLPVNSLNDPGNGTCDVSECTLREAVDAAESGDTITFDSALAGVTITLGSEITLTKDLTIDGSGLSSHVKISGGGSVRIFRIIEGVTVAIDHLDIRNGYADIGGGIDVFSGTLTVSNSTFSGNSAGDGGAININNGTLFVTDSSFVDNNAWTFSGAINNYQGWVSISGSTISGNTAPTGGGIFNGNGYVAVTNSTFSGNDGTVVAGGLLNYGDPGDPGLMEIKNSTISGNTSPYGGAIVNGENSTLHMWNTILADSSTGEDCLNAGTIATNINNLIEDGTCSPAVTGDPLLGPLADNGGSTLTMALEDGSPAIDAGHIATCEATDQRGVARPIDGDGNGTAVCDIGAYEKGFAYAIYLPLVLKD